MRILRHLRARVRVLTRDLSQAAESFLKSPKQKSVIYIVEEANWSIKWDGINTLKHLNAWRKRAKIDISSRFQKNKILHYGSSYSFLRNFPKSNKSMNNHIVTFFHGKYGDSESINQRYNLLKDNINQIDAVIYSNSIMHKRLLDFGIPEPKLFYVPVGVDTEVFKPTSEDQIKLIRNHFRIPHNALVIGSFQKDGQGWDDGFISKPEKGPDILVKTLAKVNKHTPVFCVLSGPARGYVKSGLQKHDIPFCHTYFDDPNDVAQLYKALDLYLVTSREEGGPKAIVEAMATGVPVVSTDVGMASDALTISGAGFICEIDNVTDLSKRIIELAESENMRVTMGHAGVKSAKSYDWSEIGKLCEAIYTQVGTQ